MGLYRDSRARLDRAISHGEELAKKWNAISDESLFRSRAIVSSADGWGQLLFIQVSPLSDEFALLLGEMLYQLRSALDACIYQATIYATGKNPPLNEEKLEFPICSDPSEFPKLAKRRLADLPKDIQDEIERVQPYNAPALPPEQMTKNLNRSLGILHNLARKDRHRRLHVIGSWASGIDPEFTLPPGVSLSSINVMKSGFLENDNVLATFQLKGFVSGMVVTANPCVRTMFGLNEPPLPCHESDTSESRLVQMINAVASVVSAFEKQF